MKGNGVPVFLYLLPAEWGCQVLLRGGSISNRTGPVGGTELI
jgi:hypothetical protein